MIEASHLKSTRHMGGGGPVLDTATTNGISLFDDAYSTALVMKHRRHTRCVSEQFEILCLEAIIVSDKTGHYPHIYLGEMGGGGGRRKRVFQVKIQLPSPQTGIICTLPRNRLLSSLKVTLKFTLLMH
ncbi:hypothetical protein L798_00158 [Zootermopsis nevadensis]|uniref:Uncharacterized protein n=1 Tax=Zootermopsis nevadensis TaxID=136037 RepID=A0A067RG40_ZOONE|nr:hypothetical protein L798_00158 [Zootermopsis nevadensis]